MYDPPPPPGQCGRGNKLQSIARCAYPRAVPVPQARPLKWSSALRCCGAKGGRRRLVLIVRLGGRNACCPFRRLINPGPHRGHRRPKGRRRRRRLHSYHYHGRRGHGFSRFLGRNLLCQLGDTIVLDDGDAAAADQQHVGR